MQFWRTPERKTFIHMNAYFFTAAITVSQVVEVTDSRGQTQLQPRTWETRENAVVFGDRADAAQNAFEGWLDARSRAENPSEIEINRVLAAQFVDELFTEAGGVSVDWVKTREEADAVLQSIPLDDFEQGYWADVNQLVRPGTTSDDVESLKQNLPEDVRSGLNWAPDKKFFYIVCVLSLPLSLGPPAVAAGAEPPAESEANPENSVPADEVSSEPPPLEIADLLDRESAALVVARNSIIAAWLWRKFAAETPLAANPIYIAPWCTAISADATAGRSDESVEQGEPPA